MNMRHASNVGARRAALAKQRRSKCGVYQATFSCFLRCTREELPL
jgi:hypothetical protein